MSPAFALASFAPFFFLLSPAEREVALHPDFLP
jgi:hypothetical protein